MCSSCASLPYTPTIQQKHFSRAQNCLNVAYNYRHSFTINTNTLKMFYILVLTHQLQIHLHHIPAFLHSHLSVPVFQTDFYLFYGFFVDHDIVLQVRIRRLRIQVHILQTIQIKSWNLTFNRQILKATKMPSSTEPIHNQF